VASIQFNDNDRDTRGFIRLSPPPAESTPPAPVAPARPARPAAQARPPLSPRLRYQMTIAASTVAGLLLVLLSMRMSAPRAIAPVAAPVATSVPPSAARAPTPAPTALPVVLLPAYGAPNEAPRWQIEATRAITPTAHYGGGWIQADVAGSGLIWLSRSDFPHVAIVGPDLAPHPTSAPALVYEPPPAAPPEPPQCAEAGIPGKMVRVCGTDDLAALEQRLATAPDQLLLTLVRGRNAYFLPLD